MNDNIPSKVKRAFRPKTTIQDVVNEFLHAMRHGEIREIPVAWRVYVYNYGSPLETKIIDERLYVRMF